MDPQEFIKMDPWEFIEKVETYSDFVMFLKLLSKDFYIHEDEWQNIRIDSYLEATAGWLEHSAHRDKDLDFSQPLNWKTLCHIFITAKYYE